MIDDINIEVLAEDEVIGLEFYKMHAARTRRMTERPAHEIVWRIKAVTRKGDQIPGIVQYHAHPSRQYDGIVLERVDNNSKAQPPGTLVWRHRSFLIAADYFGYRGKGFNVRRRQYA